MPEVRLRLGAENYWDDILATRLRHGETPCPIRTWWQGKASLSDEDERSPRCPARLGSKQPFRHNGFRADFPVLAHPERYSAGHNAPPAVCQRPRGLSRQAALLVDLAALSGTGDRAESPRRPDDWSRRAFAQQPRL